MADPIPTETLWAANPDPADVVEPPGALQDSGYEAATPFDREIHNRLHQAHSQWTSWLDRHRLDAQHFAGVAADGVGWIVYGSMTLPSVPAPPSLDGDGGIATIVLDHRITEHVYATKTYTASKDTYVDVDQDDSVTYTEVANGAGAPAVPAGSYRLFKVVTDAGAITAATLLGNYKMPIYAATVQDTLTVESRLMFGAGAFLDADGKSPDIGEAADPVGVVYAQGLQVDDEGLVSNLIPDLDNTYDLGDGTHRFKKIWTFDLAVEDDLGVGDDLYVAGLAVIDGDLGVGGAISVTGAVSAAGGYAFPSPASRWLSFGPAHFTANAITSTVKLWGTTDPRDSAHYLEFTDNAAEEVVRAPIYAPDGAVINAAYITFDETANHAYGAVVRGNRNSLTRINLSTVTPGTGEQLLNDTETTLTLDTAEATRTVDNSLYYYELWVCVPAHATGYLKGGRVELYLNRAG